MTETLVPVWRVEDLPQWIAVDVSIDPDSDCWLYGGNLNDSGYGWVHKTFTHRVAYEALVGPIPAGLTIDHVQARGCTSKACCWPGHLEPVTRAENSRRNAQRVRIRKSVTGLPVLGATDARNQLESILRERLTFEIWRFEEPCAVIMPYEDAVALGAYRMEQYTSEDARKEWRRILNEAERGEPVGVTRYGKPLAVIVPAEWYERADAVLAAVRHGVIPVAPSQELDPWRMQPGDCQRALADIWEALQPSEGK